ncbi:MAG: P-type conjugative transfer protein TrbJ [Burkholderiaceae bacterium]|nr:P-type conjugative transfer protein TrbJ [Burkholderiaceae bacterium]
MKKPLLFLVTTFALMTSPAHAQWVVFDPSNYSQNILTAARTLEQINNQIRQLQNEAQMLVNDARNLTSLDFSAVAQLRAALASTNRLIQEAQGLAYDVSRMDTDFARLYPEAYATTATGSRMALDARERWSFSLKALQTTMRMQAQASQNFVVDESTLADLVNRSQSAVGQLQATQATNQLLALQSRQSIQEQQLRITQDRSVALEQARTVAAQERAREVRRRFQGAGTPYTAQTVNFYSR